MKQSPEEKIKELQMRIEELEKCSNCTQYRH